MKTKEFNLSEKIEGQLKTIGKSIPVEDVREFIRLCEDNSEEIDGKSYIKISKMQEFAGEKIK